MEDINTTEPKLLKLNGTNYRIWLAQLKAYFESKRLWIVASEGLKQLLNTDPEAYFEDIVEAARADLAKNKKRPRRLPRGDSLTEEGALGTPRDTPAPGVAAAISPGNADEGSSSLTDDEVYARAEKEAETELIQDASARAIISRACNTDIGANIMYKTTAKEQLDFLKQLYAPLGRQQLSAKLSAFQGYIPKEGSKIMDIYRDLNELQMEVALISLKDKPSNNNKIARFFTAARGLDKEYSNLVIQTEISNPDLSFEAIAAHFAEYERRITAETDTRKEVREKAYGASEGG